MSNKVKELKLIVQDKNQKEKMPALSLLLHHWKLQKDVELPTQYYQVVHSQMVVIV